MIKQASYLTSVVHPKDAPSDLPHVLLLGRSNVGKSSFINAITNRKNLARVSNTPGKTLTLNIYDFDRKYYVVDAPGYGYAKRSKSMKDDFIIMIEHFILDNPNLKLIIMLIDFKIGPTKDDLETYLFLITLNLPFIVVCTKQDKVPKTHQYKQEKVIRQALHDALHIISYSNVTKNNVEYILETIENYII